jgi:acyl carrier protein
MNLPELVAAAVRRHAARGPDISLTDDDNLLEEGVLDSLGVIGLVADLESTTGCQFQPSDVVPEHFQTLRTIVGLVQRRRDGSPPAGVPAPL